MNTEDARALLSSARVAHLATIGASGRPHLVPITFALLADDALVTAIDAKPKRSASLRRLRNIAVNPQVAVLVDHYEEDWRRLWWVRADGSATVHEADEAPEGLAALAARYRQYEAAPPPGPVIVIAVTRWSGWNAAEATDRR